MTNLATDLTEHLYKRHRFHGEITARRFPLSLRDVEDRLAERGIDLSFQTVSEWAVKFGHKFTDDHEGSLSFQLTARLPTSSFSIESI